MKKKCPNFTWIYNFNKWIEILMSSTNFITKVQKRKNIWWWLTLTIKTCHFIFFFLRLYFWNSNAMQCIIREHPFYCFRERWTLLIVWKMLWLQDKNSDVLIEPILGKVVRVYCRTRLWILKVQLFHWNTI